MMKNLQLTQVPTTKTGMLIRRPVADVFEAFINPDITTKFWFTKGSGRLEAGKEVQWDWEMYNFSVPVRVKVVEENKRIVVEWDAYEEPSTIEWVFSGRADESTFVSITNSGFAGTVEEKVKKALDSTEGFTFVL